MNTLMSSDESGSAKRRRTTPRSEREGRRSAGRVSAPFLQHTDRAPVEGIDVRCEMDARSRGCSWTFGRGKRRFTTAPQPRRKVTLALPRSPPSRTSSPPCTHTQPNNTKLTMPGLFDHGVPVSRFCRPQLVLVADPPALLVLRRELRFSSGSWFSRAAKLTSRL